MRVFVAGATGVVGSALVEKLVKRGHEVVATSTTPTKLEALKRAGAEPVLMDGLYRASVVGAVAAARADVIVNEMTSLAGVRNYKDFDGEFRQTNQLRVQGSAHLLAAAAAHGAQRIVVQSFAGWPWNAGGRRAAPEDAPFEEEIPSKMRASQGAIQEMEAMVTASQEPSGVVLRYGHLYGPGTAFGPGGTVVEAVKKGAFPLVGHGAATWSFVHVDDAAEATRIAIEGGPAGVYNIADDQPAKVSEWLPELARVLGAKPPRKLPGWLARLFIGEAGLYLMNRSSGADNLKAKAFLQWHPCFPDWREGFARTLRS